MNTVSLIAKKRDGNELSTAEINAFIEQYCDERIPDYQASALLMAIFFNGMTLSETVALTEAMLNSGQRLSGSVARGRRASKDEAHKGSGEPSGATRKGPWVDKHSTGGIGDKTSLLIAPWLAAAGVNVPMISGRGLGPTGGTLDKLESYDSFRTNLSEAELTTQVDAIGLAISGSTKNLAPADRKLYALRDVTATVPSIPLITASILSKKLAESLDALILDVKVGSGAFMKTLPEARELAMQLVRVANAMGVPTKAIISDMNQPLGKAVGNANEVREVIGILKGACEPTDLLQLSRRLTAELLVLSGQSDSIDQAKQKLDQLLTSGATLRMFEAMIKAQGSAPDKLCDLGPKQPFVAKQSGFISSINGAELGELIIDLGGGRRQLTDSIDHSVGISMAGRLGDQVKSGQLICEVHLPSEQDDELSWSKIETRLSNAIQIASEPRQAAELIREEVTAD